MINSTSWERAGRTLLLAIVAILWLGLGPAPAQQSTPPAPAVKVGDTAPDFTLPDQNNKPVKLSDFKGKKNVVLAFYVLAFTGG